jgi:hypothetical protein
MKFFLNFETNLLHCAENEIQRIEMSAPKTYEILAKCSQIWEIVPLI